MIESVDIKSLPVETIKAIFRYRQQWPWWHPKVASPVTQADVARIEKAAAKRARRRQRDAS